MNFLGICRKAGKLACGHDAVKETIVKSKSQLIIMSSDASERLEREMRFLTEIPISRLNPEFGEKFSTESIVVQGAVDVCFIEEDGIVILDFKSDRVADSKKLADTYSEQLNFYALACEKIFELPIKEKIIYSFALSKEIKI